MSKVFTNFCSIPVFSPIFRPFKIELARLENVPYNFREITVHRYHYRDLLKTDNPEFKW